MANRRMFTKTITNSSRFLMIPASAQCLYFHLGMNADDDGYCEHFTIMRMTGSNPDDLKILAAKSFVRIFNDQVLIIIDWNDHNLIRSDRYTASKYKELYSGIPDVIPDVIPVVTHLEPQVRLGKVSIGKDTKNSLSMKIVLAQEVLDYFNEQRGKKRPITLTGKTKSQIMARIKEGKTLDDFKHVIDVCFHNWKDNVEMSGYLHPITIFNSSMDKRMLWSKKDDDGKLTKEEQDELDDYLKSADQNQ